MGYDEPSDEDLDEEDEPDLEDDDESDGSPRDDDGEEEGRLGDFGPDKRDYYNADVAETEADALEEEKEARRIQQKQLESMTEADFGFDEAQWMDQETDAPGQKTVTEKLPEPKIPEDMSAEERLKVLKTRYPEFEPLSRDFVDLQPLHEDLRLAAEAAEAVTRHLNSPSHKRKLGEGNTNTSASVPIAVTKYRALSAYLGVIGMYLALLTSTSTEAGLAMAPSELRDHPIVGSLVQCRQLWELVKEIPLPDINESSLVDEVDADVDLSDAAVEQVPVKQKKSKKRKSRAERAAIAEAHAEETARKARIAATEASLADLDNLVAPARKSTKSVAAPATRDDASDFGDEAPLTVEEAAAKAQRKKSLRFYTSQIAQKANKRGTASRDAGGDADLPYKERLRDRQERLTRQAEKRGGAGVDLDDLSDNEPSGPTNLEREKQDNPADEEDYYQTITSRTASKKATKSALSAAHALAASQNGTLTNITPTIDADGKRGISYEIAKNKGLTPHRKKDVRNPRVKKRVKYEEKMKKLGSSGQRKLYKGGEGRGGYGGETTGINRSVVRSTKL